MNTRLFPSWYCLRLTYHPRGTTRVSGAPLYSLQNEPYHEQLSTIQVYKLLISFTHPYANLPLNGTRAHLYQRRQINDVHLKSSYLFESLNFNFMQRALPSRNLKICKLLILPATHAQWIIYISLQPRIRPFAKTIMFRFLVSAQRCNSFDVIHTFDRAKATFIAEVRDASACISLWRLSPRVFTSQRPRTCSFRNGWPAAR